MADGTFDLDRLIAEHLDATTGSEVVDQALAVLIDADIPDDQRASAFVRVMSELLERISPAELARFRRTAQTEGEIAAMRYLAEVTEPGNLDRSGR